MLRVDPAMKRRANQHSSVGGASLAVSLSGLRWSHLVESSVCLEGCTPCDMPFHPYGRRDGSLYVARNLTVDGFSVALGSCWQVGLSLWLLLALVAEAPSIAVQVLGSR